MTMPTPRLALHAILALLGLLCAVGLWRVVTVLGITMAFDPNEGWNAYHTAALMSGHALYPGHTAYLVNNYPPLSATTSWRDGWWRFWRSRGSRWQ